MTEIPFTLIYRLYIVTGYIAGISMLVMGIVIVCLKERASKTLGAWLALSGIGMLVTQISDFFKASSVELYAGSSVPIEFFSIIISYLTVFTLFWYARQRYDAKGLLAILAIKLGGGILYRLIAVWWNRRLISSGEELATFSYTLTLFKSLFDITVAIIILVIYIKNREHDKMFPKFWIFLTVFLGFSVLKSLVYVGTIFTVSADAAGDGWAMYMIMVGTILYRLCNMAVGLYLLKRIHASAREVAVTVAD